jgi:hypothetical protein
MPPGLVCPEPCESFEDVATALFSIDFDIRENGLQAIGHPQRSEVGIYTLRNQSVRHEGHLMCLIGVVEILIEYRSLERKADASRARGISGAEVAYCSAPR